MMKQLDKLEWSSLWLVVGVILLFSMAVGVTLIAPGHIDPSWKLASSPYQVQMYEVSDPNVYVSTANPGRWGLQYVYHLKKDYTLTAFRESELVRIQAPNELEEYVTRVGDATLKLTTRLLLLRSAPQAKELQRTLQTAWKMAHPDWEKEQTPFPHYDILELYDPHQEEAFAITESDGVIESWVEQNFHIIDQKPPYDTSEGTIYVNNPKEYRIAQVNYVGADFWVYNENGQPLKNLEELQKGKLHFLSRKALIEMGEDIYRVEGCWYCHTMQSRTLVQDSVLNGSAKYPAPPSSANEYVYERVTFPGTRRIGPDLSRVGVKRPHRDWHMAHFWSPQTESKGSIMPPFTHFFDNDPSGTTPNPYSLPNYKFEGIFQYLMTKGTRITSPDHAWWLGKDPIQTIDIIEGRK